MGGKAASGTTPTGGPNRAFGGGGGKGGGGGFGGSAGMDPNSGYGYGGPHSAALAAARQNTIAQGAQDLKSAFAGTQAAGTGPVPLPPARPTPPANRSVRSTPANYSSTDVTMPSPGNLATYPWQQSPTGTLNPYPWQQPPKRNKVVS